MIRKTAKFIFSILLMAVLFFGIGRGLRYLLINDTESFTRVMLHQLYTADRNIDIAVLGSSHAYKAFMPSVMDQYFGKYTFNAGASSQTLDGSYALLRELFDGNHPERIYLELYYGIAAQPEYKDRTSMTNTYILSDYMKPSWNKVRFLLQAGPKEQYVNAFIPARREWRKLFDLQYMADLFLLKQSPEYKSFQLKHREDLPDYYVDRGFVTSDRIRPNPYWNSDVRKPIEKPVRITPENDWYRSLIDIIDYCRKQQTELVFVIVPIPADLSVGKGNYQEYHDLVASIAMENGIPFYDFNLCRKEFFDTGNYRLFKDDDHLNAVGAEAFSVLFSRLCTGEISEEELFYPSLSDKLAAEDPQIYGFGGLFTDPDTQIRYGRIISNRDSGIEYRIEVRSGEGEAECLQDYGENKDFILPAGLSHGTLITYWRDPEDPEKKGSLSADF